MPYYKYKMHILKVKQVSVKLPAIIKSNMFFLKRSLYLYGQYIYFTPSIVNQAERNNKRTDSNE